jgi:hypothetical protein
MPDVDNRKSAMDLSRECFVSKNELETAKKLKCKKLRRPIGTASSIPSAPEHISERECGSMLSRSDGFA